MQEISLGEMFRILLKHAWIIVLITLGVTALVGGYRITKAGTGAQYEATGQVVLRPEQHASGDVATQNAYANQLVATSQDVMKSTEVLSNVSKSLSREGISLPASAIQNSLTVSNQPNSLLLEVKFKSSNKTVAVSAVNTIMQEFQRLAPKYMAISKVAIIQGEMPVATSTGKGSLIKYLLAGFVLGGVLSLIVIFALEFSRHTVRDSEYLSKKYHIKTIQTI